MHKARSPVQILDRRRACRGEKEEQEYLTSRAARYSAASVIVQSVYSNVCWVKVHSVAAVHAGMQRRRRAQHYVQKQGRLCLAEKTAEAPIHIVPVPFRRRACSIEEAKDPHNTVLACKQVQSSIRAQQ